MLYVHTLSCTLSDFPETLAVQVSALEKGSIECNKQRGTTYMAVGLRSNNLQTHWL